MTELLEKAFKEVSRLPVRTQKTLAKKWLRDLQIEARRTKEAEDLRKFFHLRKDEYYSLVGKELPPASQKSRHFIKRLQAIKASLQALIKTEEIDKWLETPNPSLNDEPPRVLLGRGEVDAVYEELTAIEWGGHY